MKRSVKVEKRFCDACAANGITREVYEDACGICLKDFCHDHAGVLIEARHPQRPQNMVKFVMCADCQAHSDRAIEMLKAIDWYRH